MALQMGFRDLKKNLLGIFFFFVILCNQEKSEEKNTISSIAGRKMGQD